MEQRPIAEPAADVWPGGGRRPHIVLVLAGLGAGGAERVMSLLSKHWVEEGRRVTIVTFDHANEPVFHAMDPRVRTVRLGIDASGGSRLSGLGANVKRLWALRRALGELAPDITVSFLTKINVLALLASLGTRRRVVVSERNNPRLQQASRFWNLALAGLHWRADGIVMQTQASLECLGERARRRAFVIPNPIRISPIQGPPRSVRVLAAAGRLTWQKGFDMLIDAFALVAARHPDWMLTIWGEGNERPLLERRVERYGLAGRIRLPGNSRSPDDWTGQADAFVLSSRYEGFGNVLGEAMAAGLPVASFDCDYGPAELIRPEEDGLLVQDGDVQALATALGRLMEDAELRTRLGAAAKMAADRYHPEKIVRRWDEVLEQAASR